MPQVQLVCNANGQMQVFFVRSRLEAQNVLDSYADEVNSGSLNVIVLSNNTRRSRALAQQIKPIFKGIENDCIRWTEKQVGETTSKSGSSEPDRSG